jgi:hypothetical protein
MFFEFRVHSIPVCCARPCAAPGNAVAIPPSPAINADSRLASRKPMLLGWVGALPEPTVYTKYHDERIGM